MDSEISAHVDDEMAKDQVLPDENQSDADVSYSETTEEDKMFKNVDECVEAKEVGHPQESTTNPSDVLSDASPDTSTKKEGRMELRRAKTKGELKKQLELKRGKLKNSLLEANDSDSIPSPLSGNDQKQMDVSLSKIQKEIPETVVKWSEGDMFWARVTGHPWWPCMIFKDPNQALFTRMRRVNVRAYHFHFFGSSCERGWVVESSMMFFEGRKKFEEIRKEKMAQLNNMKAKSKSEKAMKLALTSFDIKANRILSWESAVDEAEKVFQMTNEERMNYVIGLLSKSKKKRRESTEGAKRKREDQDEERIKKKARKSEGSLKLDSQHEGLNDSKELDETTEAISEAILDDIKDISAANVLTTMTPSVTHGSKASAHIEATPERANSTRYKLRAVRKLKKLTDDEEEDDEGDTKRNRKQSVNSMIGEGSEKSEDSQNAGSLATKPAGGEAVRTQEIFKLTHNCNNYKKEEICVKCESSHPGVIKCKGPCHAPLHPACVGVELIKGETEDDAKDTDFICSECRDGQHTCFICKSKDGSTVKCGVSTCCFYYHVNCIKKLKYVKFEKNQPICPMHVCISCAADSEKSHLASRGRFFKCIRCPNSYHTGDFCIAAGSVVLSTTWIICGDHHALENKRKHRDHINAAFCFSCGQGGSLVCCESCPASYHTECCEEKPPAEGKWNCELCTDGKRPLYGEIVWCKAGIYRWWPGEICHPRNIPTNIQNLNHGIGDFPVYFFGSNDYLWTHRGRVFSFQEGDKGTKQGHSKHLIGTFNKALEEADDAARIYYEERNKKEQKLLDKKPTPYKHIKSNVPIGNVEVYKVPSSEVAKCQCNPGMVNPCGPESDCINRLMMYECDASVCQGGDKCSNRFIQLRKDADTEVFRTTDNRGWGLRTKTDIPKGRFIHEYVGDLIGEEECRERLRRAKEQNISNFYMLTLDKNRIIDAGPRGNNSRFMNHSCQPNCETQKWFVNGDVRVALFALRDIKAGEELTFNYNLECLGDKKTVCHCGTPVCSGFLGERPKSMPSDDKNLIPKKKRKKQKNVSKLAPMHEDICWRCGNPGELVLCDKVNCTKSYHMKCLERHQMPRGKWICPWHLCDEENCGKWSVKLCSMCPNSYCKNHYEGNILTLHTGRIVCDEHPETCPQLKFLLEQDQIQLDKKSKENQGEKKVNGDFKLHDVGIESPFPLVSTPFHKKARGRPPKHHKLGESPIIGSASKLRTLKSTHTNLSSLASQNYADDTNLSLMANEKALEFVSTEKESENNPHLDVVNGLSNEENMDCTDGQLNKEKCEEQDDKCLPTDESELETHDNGKMDVEFEKDAEMTSHVPVQDSDKQHKEKSESELIESQSPQKLSEESNKSPNRVLEGFKTEGEERFELPCTEKVSNGYSEMSTGSSPRKSLFGEVEEPSI